MTLIRKTIKTNNTNTFVENPTQNKHNALLYQTRMPCNRQIRHAK